MQNTSLIITGATGLIGTNLVDIVKNDSSFNEIIILARKKLPSLENYTHLKQYLVDFSKPESYDNYVKADTVVCSLGTTIKKAGSQEKFREVDFTYPLLLAKTASKNNCSKFILVSSVGSSPDIKNFYLRVKGELERELVKLNFKSIHILHPSLLLGKREEHRTGEEFSRKFFPLISFLFPAKFRPIEASVIALKIKEISQNDYSGIYHYEGNQLYPEKI